MANDQRQFLTASCGDLMLAKDCVSDLKSANFMGAISVRPLEPADVLQGDALQVYGSYIGGSVGRGILIGSLLGLAAGTAVSYAFDSASLYLPAAVLALALGAVFGCVAGWRSARGSRPLRKERERQGRFVLRCDGNPSEIATAFEALQTSPCRNLQIHGGDCDVPNLIAARETEAPVA
jgi:hypothetical protein